MIVKTPITKAQARALCKAQGPGRWAIRTEPIACAADTGDSGFAQTFAYEGKDIVRFETPKAGYRVKAYKLEDK